MIVFFTLISVALASATMEDIYFEELSKSDSRRNIRLTQQDELVLNLKRPNGEDIELHLRENKAINVNAPVYDAAVVNGKNRAILKRHQAIEGVRFYYDLDKKAALQISCETLPDGKCSRQIEGIVDIDGETYDVKPKPSGRSASYSINMDKLPHRLKRSAVSINYDDITSNIESKDLQKRSIKILKQKMLIQYALCKRVSSVIIFRPLMPLCKLSTVLNRHNYRQKHKIYTVESIIAIDPPLWEHLVQRTKNKFGTTDDAEVEKEARRYYSTLIHLVSMAYEGINHPDFTIKIVISGFLFLKKPTATMIEDKVYTEDGKHTEGVHFGESLSRMYKEMRENGDLPNADHVYTFTSSGAQGAAGANCFGCICETSGWGWSISQADEFSYEARLATHEFGHSLGLYHIDKGRYDDIICKPEDGWVMGSVVKGRYWKFSKCSIRELQNYLTKTGHKCLLDNADVYNSGEWNAYTSKMPGEIRNITEQCIDMNTGKLFINQEKQSVLCNDVTDPDFCSGMSCVSQNGCRNLVAADGTPCGLPSSDKWCIAARCVSRNATEKERQCEEENWQYQKNLTQTRSGIPCQRWDSQSPHKHKLSSASVFPDETLADAGNFCRNPSNEPYAWCYTTDKYKRWDYCDYKICTGTTPETTGEAESCYKTWAETYLGTKSKAKSGYTCQRWDSDSPHSHNQDIKDKFLDASVAEAANYCRDPTARGKPWCFLNVRWDYCDVPACSSAKQSKCLEEIRQNQKTLTETRSGIPCQRWDSQSPHKHTFSSASDFPNETIADAGNFCRNPDNAPYVWCFTTDKNKRWDFCGYNKCTDETCYSKDIEYTGTLNLTKGGISCQSWDSSTPHTNYYKNKAEGNACRRLGKDKPWCYLGRTWDYCDIDNCTNNINKIEDTDNQTKA